MEMGGNIQQLRRDANEAINKHAELRTQYDRVSSKYVPITIDIFGLTHLNLFVFQGSICPKELQGSVSRERDHASS